MLPTRGRLLAEADRVGLETETVDTLGDHYARTLQHWQRQLLGNLEAIHSLGFDNRFVRMWRYYLAYCEAAFRTGRTDLQRLVLRKPAVAA